MKAKTTAADLLITDVAELVTCDGALGEGPLGVITDGALAANEGRIVWVGTAREADEKLERVLTADPGIGVARHADAGYPEAIATAESRGVRLPMRTGH